MLATVSRTAELLVNLAVPQPGMVLAKVLADQPVLTGRPCRVDPCRRCPRVANLAPVWLGLMIFPVREDLHIAASFEMGLDSPPVDIAQDAVQSRVDEFDRALILLLAPSLAASRSDWSISESGSKRSRRKASDASSTAAPLDPSRWGVVGP